MEPPWHPPFLLLRGNATLASLVFSSLRALSSVRAPAGRSVRVWADARLWRVGISTEPLQQRPCCLSLRPAGRQLIPTGFAGRTCAARTTAVASDLVLEAGFTSQRVCVFQNYVKAMRLFVGEPVWTAYNRPADHFEARGQYLDFLAQTV